MRNLKKLLAVVVAVTILLTAMVPAFAASFTYDNEAQTLNDLDLYAGTSTTEFVPDLGAKLTRAQGAVLVLKMFNLLDEANKVDADKVAETLAAFKDAKKIPTWADEAVAYAVENKIISGRTDGNFDPNSSLKAKDFAMMVLKELGVESAYATAADKLAEVGGLDIDNEKDLIRDDVVGMIYNALDVKYADGKSTVIEALVAAKPALKDIAVAAGLISADTTAKVSQVAGNKLEVAFSNAVDTSKVTFAVKKGSVKVNVKPAAWDADKKVATLEAYANLTEGDYTVAVAGIDTLKTKEYTVAVKPSTVTKIEFLSDKLVKTSNVKEGTVGYKVVDQFGVDVTKSNTVTVSASVYSGGSWTESDGSISVITSGTELKVGDIVSVTAIYPSNATVATATLTVAPEAKVASITFGSLYNKDNKVLRTNTNLSDDVFKFEATVKDQYGNVIDNTSILNSRDQILVNPSNSALTSTFVKEDDKVWLKVTGKPTSDGTYTITTIALSNGANAVATVKVEKAIFVDSLTLQTPADMFIENEALYIPFVSVDQYGNALTKYSDIEPGVTLSVSDNTRFAVSEEKNPVDGTYRIKLTTTATAEKDDTVVVTAIANNKISTVTLKVNEEKYPVRIDSISADVAKKLVAGATIAVDKDSFVVKDQYDRDIALGSYREGTDNKTYWIKLESSATDKVDVTGAVYSNAGDSFVGDTTTGSSTITAKLMAGTDEVSNGALEFAITNVDKADIASYEIGDIGTVYSTTTENANEKAAYAKDVNVYGKTANGDKVALKTADILDIRTTKAGTLDYSAGKVYSASIADRSKDETITVVATVSGKDGVVATVTKTVTVSGAAKVAGDIAVKADNTESFADNIAVMTRAHVNGLNGKVMSSHAQYTSTRADVYFEVKDQYGVASADVKPAFYTFSVKDASGDAQGATGYAGGTYNVSSTGTITASGAVAGDEITVNAITIDGKVATVKIIVVD